jgi:hypothetical protein
VTVGERFALAVRVLRTLLALPPADRASFLDAYALQLRFALRSRFVRSWRPWLPEGERLLPHGEPPSGPAPDQRLLALFELAESAQLVGLSCLPRALALGRYLAHNGCRTQLVLGVRRGSSGVEGHAWRQWGSRVLQGEAFAASFSPLRFTASTPLPAQRETR